MHRQNWAPELRDISGQESPILAVVTHFGVDMLQNGLLEMGVGGYKQETESVCFNLKKYTIFFFLIKRRGNPPTQLVGI